MFAADASDVVFLLILMLMFNVNYCGTSAFYQVLLLNEGMKKFMLLMLNEDMLKIMLLLYLFSHTK